MQPQLEVEYIPEYKLSTVQTQYSTDLEQCTLLPGKMYFSWCKLSTCCDTFDLQCSVTNGGSYV